MTEPPAPVPAVVLTICAPEAIVIRGAVTATNPALPVVPGSVLVAICDPGPLIERRPVTLTVTLPAFPVLAGNWPEGPSAVLEIVPPSTSDKFVDWMVTSPAFPVLPALASDAITPPARSSMFGALTLTDPPAPA